MPADHDSGPPPLPATPPEAIEKTIRDAVIVGDRTFVIERPGESDKLLDRGLRDPVEEFIRWNPGLTPKQALAKMIDIVKTKAILRAAEAEAVAAVGGNADATTEPATMSPVQPSPDAGA